MASSSSPGDGMLDPRLQFYQAIRRNDWYNLRDLLDKFPLALTERITDDGETVLILVAKQGKKSNLLLRRLIDYMPNEVLTQCDNRGNTALHAAAVVGDVDGAKILVSKNQDLADISNEDGHLPFHVAATRVHRDLMLYLLNVTTDNVESNLFVGQNGAKLICNLISSGFYGFLWVNKNSTTPNFMQLNKQDPVFVCRSFFSKVLDIIVPQLKNIRRTKVLHLQAMELLQCLCKELMRVSSSDNSDSIFRSSFLLAAQCGISEVVEEILKSFPNVINCVDADKHSALHLAVMYRHENVFSVLNGLSGESFAFLSTSLDYKGDNILHLAGYRAQQYQLDLVSSAVLQMQRELQWFQEVERLVLPQHKKQKNEDGMTPLQLFQKEHKEMEVYEGQWMIGMANSCTVATTIIATIAFAAAITVPGGNKDDGTPMFSGGAAFIIFAISNALALFSSICTLLIFLSILTSRYATIDYLYSLPNRLIMGLVALFFSITSMIISFSATLYLVFAQDNNWILIPIVGLALLPVDLFVRLQFSLLKNMMLSTYGSILRPKKEEKLTNIWE